MKKYFSILIVLFSTFSVNVFSQINSYPFDVNISGNGTQSIIFIPGFASLGDVWNETKCKNKFHY